MTPKLNLYWHNIEWLVIKYVQKSSPGLFQDISAFFRKDWVTLWRVQDIDLEMLSLDFPQYLAESICKVSSIDILKEPNHSSTSYMKKKKGGM